jgi:hypothetical protein
VASDVRHKTLLRGTLVVIARSFASLLSVSLALWVIYPRIEAVEHVKGGRSGPTHLPWTFGETGENNQLDLTLAVHWGTPTRWKIRPDDILTLLRVNDEEVPLSAAQPQEGLRDPQRGFEIDLGPWLHHGDNHVEMVVTNTGGPGGIAMRPLVGWRFVLLAAGLLPWLWALARVFRLRRLETRILGAALLVLCSYWAATPWYERTYDVKRYGETGHLDYVIYLAENARLPPPQAGWQYYQPPVYYAVGALAWRWAGRLGISGPETLQAYSLALWLVFLTASVAALKLTLRRSAWVLGLAIAALALWPSGVIDAVRIGNDLALYATAAVATYFMVRWWRGHRRRHLAGMALSVAAAFLCKSSGVALLAAAFVLLGLRILRGGRWRELGPWLETLLAAATMLSGATLGVARNVWYWKQGKLSSWLVANIGGLDASLRVPDDLRQYIPLDVPVFLCEPWVNSRNDATGRSNFWNYFLRSSLSGEFSFEGKLHEGIATLWGVLLLALAVALLLRLYARRPRLTALWRDAPWWSLGLLWLASAIAARHTYAFSCQSDFRYVAPAIVPFVLACARGGWVMRGLLSIVVASSFVFFMSL